MIRAVIFDIDGTLIDSVDGHAQAWVDAFAEFGKSVPFEEVRKQIGKGGDHLLPVFLTPQEIEQFGKELEAWRSEHVKRTFIPTFRPFPKVRELFEELIRRDKKITLASSAKSDELEQYKKIATIDDLVPSRLATSADDADRSKPDPDIFQAALSKLKTKPENAIAVGDTPYDAEAASKIGLHTIGVLCGGFPRWELKQAGSIAIYRDPADLLNHIEVFA